jgi:hypothetical protein
MFKRIEETRSREYDHRRALNLFGRWSCRTRKISFDQIFGASTAQFLNDNHQNGRRQDLGDGLRHQA